MKTERLSACGAAAFALAILALPAFADEAFDACVKAVTAENTQCGEAWIGREQAGLDDALHRLKAVADGNVAEALEAEERAWETFRDVSCSFKLDEGFGGAGGPTGYHACRAKVIAERRDAIEGYIVYIDN